MSRMMIFVLVVAMLCAFGAAQAATERDITAAGSEVWINGALFSNWDYRSTGTGLFDPFLTIQANGTEEGYNTDERPLEFDENQNILRTHALALATVPTLEIDGVLYRELRLDVNQVANGPISLDTLRIYQTNNRLLTNFDTGWDKVYDMGSDDWVKIGSATGSGSGDMRLFLNNSLFTDQYLVLYCKMGVNVSSNDGFEEWGVRTSPDTVPEPSSLLALFTGISGLGGLAWRRRR